MIDLEAMRIEHEAQVWTYVQALLRDQDPPIVRGLECIVHWVRSIQVNTGHSQALPQLDRALAALKTDDIDGAFRALLVVVQAGGSSPTTDALYAAGLAAARYYQGPAGEEARRAFLGALCGSESKARIGLRRAAVQFNLVPTDDQRDAIWNGELGKREGPSKPALVSLLEIGWMPPPWSLDRAMRALDDVLCDDERPRYHALLTRGLMADSGGTLPRGASPVLGM